MTTLTPSRQRRIDQLRVALHAAVAYAKGRDSFAFQEITGFQNYALAFAESGLFENHGKNRARGRTLYRLKPGPVRKQITAYLAQRTADMQQQAEKNKIKCRELYNKSRSHIAVSPADPRVRVVSLVDHRHWPHGNLSGVRSCSSLGGNSFAYHG